MIRAECKPRSGLKKPLADLQRLEQTHTESLRFLQDSRRRLAELEQIWSIKRPAYERKLEREGEEIVKAKRCLGVIDGNPEHFRKSWEQEEQKWMSNNDQQKFRRRDRDGG